MTLLKSHHFHSTQEVTYDFILISICNTSIKDQTKWEVTGESKTKRNCNSDTSHCVFPTDW